ncbi:hypothetical protein [Psychromonas aquatilis]|uniref:CdiI immunity protein domain-containing protein n=1 Tax=Psychromonas aquatilis TaxID=2005072 RepID=A0ABU9GUK9_9GAMM
MQAENYFLENFPDGVTNAIDEFYEELECSNQDSYELLIKTFGDDYSEDRILRATEADFLHFAKYMESYFELNERPPLNLVKSIIANALTQWK